MIDPRITDLRFNPQQGSRWAGLGVGTTIDNAFDVLGRGRNDRSALYHRIRRGEILLDLPLPQYKALPSDIYDADTGRGAGESPRQTKVRPCLRCRQAFQSEGPGNRLCDGCRGRNVSPFEPG